jgi:hypothetical protein
LALILTRECSTPVKDFTEQTFYTLFGLLTPLQVAKITLGTLFWTH